MLELFVRTETDYFEYKFSETICKQTSKESEYILGLNILSPLFSINYVNIEQYTNFKIKENNQKIKNLFS